MPSVPDKMNANLGYDCHLKPCVHTLISYSLSGVIISTVLSPVPHLLLYRTAQKIEIKSTSISVAIEKIFPMDLVRFGTKADVFASISLRKNLKSLQGCSMEDERYQKHLQGVSHSTFQAVFLSTKLFSHNP